MRVMLTIMLVLSLVIGAVSQVEAVTPPADPLCLLLVTNDLYTRASRYAWAVTKDTDQAVAIYREQMISLIEKSPLRVLREKLGPDPSPEEAFRAVEEASKACPAWAKKKAANPLIRETMLRHLALVAARGQPTSFSLGFYDRGGGDSGGKGREARGSVDLDRLLPNPSLAGAVLVAVGGFLNAAAASARNSGVPASTTRVYESLGQAAIAAGTLMLGLDVLIRGDK